MPFVAVGFMKMEAALRVRDGPWPWHGCTLSHGVSVWSLGCVLPQGLYSLQ